MAFTPEEVEKLKERLFGPKEVEYKSAAGSRRVENHDIGQTLEVLQAVQGSSAPGPRFMRAAFNKGYRK